MRTPAKIGSRYILSVLQEYADDRSELEELYIAAPRYAETLSLVYDQLSTRRSKRILDFGTGSGWMAMLIKSLFSWHDVVASDVEISEKVKMRLEKARIQPVDKCMFKGGSPLVFNDGCFDICLLLEVLEHVVEDPRYVMHEMHRILSSQGFLYITTPNIAHVYNRFLLLMGRQPQLYLTGYKGTRGHFREWTMAELVNLLQDSGFGIADRRYLDAVSSMGNVRERIPLRLSYYPYKALVKIRPSFRSQIFVAAKTNGLPTDVID